MRTRDKGIQGAKKKIKSMRSKYDKRKTTINVDKPAKNICYFFKLVVMSWKNLKSCTSASFNAPVLLYSMKYYQIYHKCSIAILPILSYNTTEESYYRDISRITASPSMVSSFHSLMKSNMLSTAGGRIIITTGLIVVWRV